MATCLISAAAASGSIFYLDPCSSFKQKFQCSKYWTQMVARKFQLNVWHVALDFLSIPIPMDNDFDDVHVSDLNTVDSFEHHLPAVCWRIILDTIS